MNLNLLPFQKEMLKLIIAKKRFKIQLRRRRNLPLELLFQNLRFSKNKDGGKA